MSVTSIACSGQVSAATLSLRSDRDTIARDIGATVILEMEKDPRGRALLYSVCGGRSESILGFVASTITETCTAPHDGGNGEGRRRRRL